MSEPDKPPTLEEREFQKRHRAAWDEMRAYIHSPEAVQDPRREKDPQRRLAPQFFQIYLEKRPSAMAEKALESAFTMWGNINKGVSEQVREAIDQISLEEDVWDKVEHGIKRVFFEDGKTEEGLRLLTELADRVVPLKSRSALLSSVADTHKNRQETEKARRAYEQVVAWDASPWHVEQARGHLYELAHLNIGQPAPDFALTEIDGRPIALKAHRGRIALLHFWSTTCGWCSDLYPALRSIAAAYPPDQVSLIGFSLDDDFAALRAHIEKERFTWPQVCEGKNWGDTAFKLYNATAIPTQYLLDREGRIADKLIGGGPGSAEKLENAVRALL